MATMPENFYDRYDRSKNYDKHLFLAGRVLQSAELNEVQTNLSDKITQLANSLLKDGDIINGASVSVNIDTGLCTCGSGSIYLSGSVRGVGVDTLSISTNGIVNVGVYLQEAVITELEDPALRDPAIGVRNYQEPGASRFQVNTAWGFAGDGQDGEFYPIWVIEDGVVLSKEPPPQIDAISNAIAIYDRQSTGGTYVVSGLRVTALPDLETGQQVYSIAEGEARIDGRNVPMSVSRREVYEATPDLRRITSEPHLSTGIAPQRVNVDRTPIKAIISVQITAEKTATITHGAFTGAQDALPDSSVLELVEVTQGATTYAQGTDYKLTAGKVDWSLIGSEPSPGSTYSVTYKYITSVTPTGLDETGMTVAGALSGTLIQVTYDASMPRYDRLAVNSSGQFVWIEGVSADYAPVAPQVPSNLLLLATVYQNWFIGSARQLRNDGIRVVPMADIEDIRTGVSDLYDLMAEQKLRVDASARSGAAARGLFVDAFRNNAQRDAGIEQTAVTLSGVLTIPMSESVVDMPVSGGAPVALTKTETVRLSQVLRSTAMLVNPYQSFDPLPATTTLQPAVDNFVRQVEVWSPSIIQWTNNLWLGQTTNQLLSTTASVLPNLNQRDVSFILRGFGPNENLTSVIFDGINVTESVVGV